MSDSETDFDSDVEVEIDGERFQIIEMPRYASKAHPFYKRYFDVIIAKHENELSRLEAERSASTCTVEKCLWNIESSEFQENQNQVIHPEDPQDESADKNSNEDEGLKCKSPPPNSPNLYCCSEGRRYNEEIQYDPILREKFDEIIARHLTELARLENERKVSRRTVKQFLPKYNLRRQIVDKCHSLRSTEQKEKQDEQLMENQINQAEEQLIEGPQESGNQAEDLKSDERCETGGGASESNDTEQVIVEQEPTQEDSLLPAENDEHAEPTDPDSPLTRLEKDEYDKEDNDSNHEEAQEFDSKSDGRCVKRPRDADSDDEPEIPKKRPADE